MSCRPRSRSAVVFLVPLSVILAGSGMGCAQFLGIEDLPPLASDGGTTVTPPDASPLDAVPSSDDGSMPSPPDAGPAPDAGPLPNPDTLVDRGLLTRYFIDEDTDGTDTTTLEDSGPDPTLPLTIDYGGAGEFVDDGGNRGLRWNAITDDATAEAPLAENGKVWLGLDRSTTGTIEIVVDVNQFQDGSRLSHIGEAQDSGVFTLRIDDPEGLTLTWNNGFNANHVSWDVDLVAAGRTVLHVVYDSRRVTVAERVRLYVDGVEQPADSGNPPGRDEVIALPPGSSFVYSLGNMEAGGRGVAGTFYYASMYSAALDPVEVMHNFDILDASDDGQ